MTGEPGSTLSVASDTVDAAAALLTVGGTLDGSTYRCLRDAIIKSALEEPKAVIVDVSHLDVPAESAWVVFTSARWHVATWPEVPIMLVCADRASRSAINRNGITRYVPVYATLGAAISAASSAESTPLRRRARAELPSELASLGRARELVTEWLTAWSQAELVPVTKILVTTFVENVLQHTDSNPCIRLEFDGSAVTVAVADTDSAPAARREDRRPHPFPSGLQIASALCRAWGNAPTSSGKTVWAVIGPENRL